MALRSFQWGHRSFPLLLLICVLNIQLAQCFSPFSVYHGSTSGMNTARAAVSRLARPRNLRLWPARSVRKQSVTTCQESGTEQTARVADDILPSPVPANMNQAIKVFWDHPTPKTVGMVLAVGTVARLAIAPFGVADVLAAGTMVGAWIFQEWAMHRYLLHADYDWLGTRIHKGHHAREYFHVCIDDLSLSLPWTAAAAAFFLLLLPLSTPVGLTCFLAYMGMGLHYEWSHYLAHTKAVPSLKLWRDSKRAHTKHHLADESTWFGFTLPAVDDLFDTAGELSKEA